MRKIYIVGIGMGNPNTVTVKGLECIEQSDVLIGAKRMVDSFMKPEKKEVYAIAPGEILSWIKSHEEVSQAAILMSGDLGFFSGANKLRTLICDEYGSVLGNEHIEFEYIAGISSLSYFFSKIGLSWEDAKILSLHGRSENYVSVVMNHSKTFFLTDGGENTVRSICQNLESIGLGNAEVFVGEKLSYEDETITKGTAGELSKRDFDSLSVMVVLNHDTLFRQKDTLGIKDDDFIRGNVPMTKEEVRTLAVSKLNLKENETVYDIGAGTGSVTMELALACRYGSIYAIETKDEGISLIEQNKDKFNAKNVHIIKGMAPEAIKALPIADKAFIGGSKGNLDEIIKTLISQNPNIRIVIDVAALESIGEAISCVKKYGFKDVDISQVMVSKGKALGHYNLMMGQNPIYIISVQGV